MEIKAVFAILGGITGLIAFIQYFLDIFKKKTQPHAYTWLIWSLSQWTATAGLLYGGSGLGSAIGFAVNAVLTSCIFALSLRYGTKNITRIDTALLVLALATLAFWWLLHDPLLAVILASCIDVSGYIPTIRKGFYEPWSETLSLYILFEIGSLLILASLKAYNALTVTYILALTAANVTLVTVLGIRRMVIQKPY